MVSTPAIRSALKKARAKLSERKDYRVMTRMDYWPEEKACPIGGLEFATKEDAAEHVRLNGNNLGNIEMFVAKVIYERVV